MIKRHLLESKDHLIDKLPSLSSGQKEELKAFFKKHPNYEAKIDWNRKDLSYSDFEGLLALEGKSKSQAKKNGLAGLTEGTDYQTVKVFSKAGYTLYQVYTHLASKTLASPKVGYGNITGKWCISMNSPQYWSKYFKWGWHFFFLIADRKCSPDVKPAFYKIAFAYNFRSTSVLESQRMMIFNAEDESCGLNWVFDFFFTKERSECKEVYSLIKDGEKSAIKARNVSILDALTINPGMQFGAPGHGFSFSKPTPARAYVKVLMMLKDNPLKKWQILTNLNLNGDIPQRSVNERYDWEKRQWVKTEYSIEDYWKHVNVSGQHSNMFIAMREAGLIQYRKSDRTWSWGPNAEPYIRYWDLDKKWNEYLKTHPRHDKY